ncbi:MAG TPA: hypothetical protein VM554_15550 [Acidisarcina sp.]|nr:hypothetical protein [Acidisarcina sp.]
MNITDTIQSAKVWLTTHPYYGGLWVVIESAAIGAVLDAVTTGMYYSTNGLKHLSFVIVTTVGLSIRNYIRQSPIPPPSK